MSTTQIAPGSALRSFQYLTNHVLVHADASDTNGQFAALEMRAFPGSEPPMHFHENEDELFIVLEGRMKLICGGFETVLSAGESAMARRGTPHTFKILTPSLRSMVIFTPAGAEEFFRALANDPSPSFERIATTAARYGSRLVI